MVFKLRHHLPKSLRCVLGSVAGGPPGSETWAFAGLLRLAETWDQPNLLIRPGMPPPGPGFGQPPQGNLLPPLLLWFVPCPPWMTEW